MPGTSSGSKNNEWLQYMKDCAAKYHEQKQPKPAKAAKAAKNNKSTKSTKEEQTVREWQTRKEDVNRKQAHANMKRVVCI